MLTKNITRKIAICTLAVIPFLNGCNEDDEAKNLDSAKVDVADLKDYSATPSLVKSLSGFEGVKISTLISSEDKLAGSPDFIFGPQPDGGGLMKNPNGKGYIMLNNHEIAFSVSRIYLDENFKPEKGEYILDAAGGKMRLCSATLATPAEHGFGPVFLTAGESNDESMIHGLNPLMDVANRKSQNTLPALGKSSAENAVPLPKDAYAGKTAIFIGEDESTRKGLGQVNLYLGNTGDLTGGKLYMLRRKDLNAVETDMQVSSSYDVEFVEYTNVATSTGAQLADQTVDKSAIQFARVEDLDYGKGGGAASRTLYFVSTGVANNAATPIPGLTMWGRLYKSDLDANDPLKGKLTPLLDGGIDPGNSITNPDNVCVTKNYVYIQEDGDSFYKDNKHDGRVWQYNISNRALKPMIEMNHRRTDAAFNAKFNPLNDQRLSSWEYGAMYDISDIIGVPDTFVLNIHPHTWKDDKFKNADGSGLITNNEGGQTVILTGVPR